MAVQKSKKSRSARDMGRAHHNMTVPTLSEDRESGETHRRHHITSNGYYKGKKVVSE